MTEADELRDRVLEANLGLVRHRLVTLTWGNASEIDRERGVVAIKPSGVSYEAMRRDDIVLVDLSAKLVEGDRRPSTDTLTHLALYRAFAQIGGVVHAHSPYATAFAQAEEEIPVLGTTHADLCPGPIPVTRRLSEEEVRDCYEEATGTALCEVVERSSVAAVPCALAAGHGLFAWGADAVGALEHAVTAEEVAHLAYLTLSLSPNVGPLSGFVVERHFTRKHGPDAYYGQGD